MTTVRKKLLIINSVIIVLLAGITVFTAWYASRRVIKEKVEHTLIDVVSDSANDLEISSGVVGNDFQFVNSDVYISIYSSDGTLINGSQPGTEAEDMPINKGILRNCNIGGESYLVYDFEVNLVGRSSIFVRGITENGSKQINTIMLICVLSAIGFTIFALTASLLVIKNAVKPLEKMTQSVNAISETKDLSKRLLIDETDEDIKGLQIAYNQMLERLELVFKNQERFTSDVSHELRTPLTVILAESEYALNEAKTTEERESSLNLIHRQTKKLVNITNQLLEFSRFVNKAKIDLEVVDISELVLDVSACVNENNIKLSIDVDADVWVAVEMTLFIRLLQNLVDNAIKYGKLNGNVWVELKKVEDKAVLSVKDDGIGMSEETLKHIYDRFFQADSSRSNTKGLGLGLSYVKEIVRLFNAEITVDSKEGLGSCFAIAFKTVEPLENKF